ncbi:MAG: AbrB/MazE/SpoVT family DNA-binding domain-containing protein [Candidatus Heimdallarchaeota archaeon]
MLTIKVTRNGQMTIPAELRKKYGIKEGTILFIEDVGDGLKLTLPDWIEREAGTGTYSVKELKAKLDKERESWV